jgi:protein associated with RNAse G/E
MQKIVTTENGKNSCRRPGIPLDVNHECFEIIIMIDADNLITTVNLSHPNY